MKQTKHSSRENILKILAAPKIELPDLKNFLREDEMPALEPTPLGRYRLIQSLRNKYGPSYRNKRGVMKLLRDFDKQREFIVSVLKARV